MTRKKFVPLFAKSGADSRVSVLLPGRHPCQCLATRHGLVGNCTNCGRIVCEQEGSGSCYYCGKLVLSSDERRLLETDNKVSQKYIERLKSLPWAPGTPTPPWALNRQPRRRRQHRVTKPEDDKLDDVSDSFPADHNVDEVSDEDNYEDYLPPTDMDAQTRLEEGLANAIIQRDRLLQFDATSVKRTQVIDDELDYFVSEGVGAASMWLDPQTRARVARRVEELREQRRALRTQSAFGLRIDLANMTLTEQELHLTEPGPREEDLECLSLQGQESEKKVIRDISDPLINFPIPKFVPQSTSLKPSEKKPENEKLPSFQRPNQWRLQDADQQKVDRGLCLSMNQPWASLLVRGVKIHEGRSWYSAHRGPLWIAANKKMPSEEEVSAVESGYIKRGVRRADFPLSYPTGVLLGCVNVDEVLPQKEYRLKFPDGESEAPYVFLCSDPRELLIKLPMNGQQRIYRLDPHIHTAAKENIT